MLENYTKSDFLKLRRARIEREYASLNNMQKKAVFSTQGPLLLLAGAGSGKTTVLINRIANIIKFGNAYNSEDIPDTITDFDCEILKEYLRTGDEALRESADKICRLNPAPPWSVIAITFTNKAANELKERLARAVGDAANDIWAATFHSACVRILRRDIDKLGFSSSFTIYDASDSERVIKDIIKQQNIDDKAFPPRAVQNIISRAKDGMMSPKAFSDESNGDFRLEHIAKIYALYQENLRNANALDFDDIIMHTVNLLTDYPDVLAYYQRKFRYVLIDEYQDTNHAQYLLAALLAGGSENICVVGDDDQSIYRFRGATIENILRFEDSFKNASVIRLEQNYRSTSSILNVANSVIKNNIGRKGKSLWTDNTDGTLPVVFCAQNEREEAAYITDTVLNHKAAGGSFRDCAVLYRINAQSMQLENAFKRNAIPYRIIGGLRFFDRAEVKDMLAYLCVIANPSDTLRLKRIINVPARKIGAKTVETVEAIAAAKGISAFDVLRRAREFPELSRNSAPLIGFAEMIDTLRGQLDTLPLGDLFDALVEKNGYVRELMAKNDIEARTRMENILELKSNIVEYQENGGGTLTEFLEEVSLYTDIERYDADADAVVMMTIHSAKGLEFPLVFVSGMEEGLFPGFRSMGIDEEIEEERRLFYVAATRAREHLYLTYAKSRMMFGQTRYSNQSRFLGEIPDSLVEHKCIEPVASEFHAELTPRAPRRTPPVVTGFHSDIARHAAAPVSNPFNAGDRVTHKVFKGGLVISSKPVGGDVLLEIAFDGVGTKRLLYKAAAQYLSKE